MERYRILAYGGTSYSERIRVGRWPGIENGVMADRYAAREKPLSFGVGVLGGFPYLILRQLQDASRRGGYPFTVLLDPGREAWEKMRWNGALLMSQLLADVEMADILLHDVESWTEQAMTEFVARLATPTPACGTAREISTLQQLWVGVHLRDDPIAVNPEDDVLEAVPEPSQMASCLADLPVCFRLGRGWLLGGSLSQAKGFGCNLVYDSETGNRPRSLQLVFSDGLDTWKRWKELGCSDHWGPAIEVLSETPACLWPFATTEIMEAVRSGGKEILHAAARKIAAADNTSPQVKAFYCLWCNVTRGENIPVAHDHLEFAMERILQGEQTVPSNLLRLALRTSSPWSDDLAAKLTRLAAEDTAASRGSSEQPFRPIK